MAPLIFCPTCHSFTRADGAVCFWCGGAIEPYRPPLPEYTAAQHVGGEKVAEAIKRLG